MLFENLIVSTYKSRLLTRHDPDGCVFYYSHEDFPTLSCREFEFLGDEGQRLRGYFYTDEAMKYTDRLVIFEHGMGCGHRGYMREIATICAAGYPVFTYDHTGTLASGGEHIGGFTQSLSDLNRAIYALKDSGEADGKRLAVIGHSWGGFSTMNIGALHRDITHIVAMSGFTSPKKIIGAMLGKLRIYLPKVFKTEVERFGGLAEADACFSLLTTEVKALIVHSRDDNLVPYYMFEELERATSGRENIRCVTLDGKRHNPNYTESAVRYKDEFFAERATMKKKKRLETEAQRREFVAKWDWARMTEQDMDFWQMVFDFLEG